MSNAILSGSLDCTYAKQWFANSWWRYPMETFSASLALCAGNSLVIGGFPSQRPVTWSFGVFFDLRLNTWLSKQSIHHSTHYDVTVMFIFATVRHILMIFFGVQIWVACPSCLVIFVCKCAKSFSIGINGYILVVDKRLHFNDTIKRNFIHGTSLSIENTELDVMDNQ